MKRDEIEKMESGRELDDMIADKVMGWPRISPNDPFRMYKDFSGVIINGVPMKFPELGNGLVPDHWRPSTDIAAAWLVVLEMRKKHGCNVRVSENAPFAGYGERTFCAISFGTLQYSNPDCRLVVSADTAQLAICKAALLAVMGVES